METAHEQVYQNRTLTFMQNGLREAVRLLPEVLRPLGKILAKMKRTLITAYKSFEETFDGSRMSLVFEELRPLLVLLEERAKGLVRVEPPIQNPKLNVTEGRGRPCPTWPWRIVHHCP